MNCNKTIGRGILAFLGLIVVVLAPLPASSQTVTAILGANVGCDTAVAGCVDVPLAAAIICDGQAGVLDCPQFFAPDWAGSPLRFFGITNRTNPPRCVQSTNGGGTWGLCPSNPFTGAVDLLGAVMTVGSDGSLIAAADQGVNNCIIRKSTDYGVSWSTVFTDLTANVSCGLAFGNPQPSFIRCAKVGGYCVVIGREVGTFNLIAYFSSDIGTNWTKGTPFNIVSGDEEIGVQISENGTAGSLTRYNITYNTANWTFAYTSGTDWLRTTVIPLPAGAGAASRCSSGASIFGGQAVVCGPDGTMTGTYRYFTHGAGTIVLIKSFTMPGGLTFADAPDQMVVGYDTTTAYLVGRNVGSTAIQVYVTRDTLTSTYLIGTLTPTTALIAGCCRGDIYVRGKKIYFTSGATSTQAFFGRIQ